MPTILDRLRAELLHATDLRDEFDQITDLQDRYADAAEGSAERVRIGGLIADLSESIADHLDASRLARGTAFLNPDDLRADAPQWRSGEMYIGP